MISWISFVLPWSDLSIKALVHIGEHLLGIFIRGALAKSDEDHNDRGNHNDHDNHNDHIDHDNHDNCNETQKVVGVKTGPKLEQKAKVSVQ